MKVFLKIVLVIIVVLVLVISGGIFYITRGLEAGSQVEISNIDLRKIDDGIYNGKFSSGRWTNEVSVAVKDHQITGIEIIKDVTIPKPEWTQQLFNSVIEEQDIDVDVISGATVTCKAYLKAIENALN